MLQCSKLTAKSIISIYDCKEVGKVEMFYIGKGLRLRYVQIMHNGIRYLISTKDLGPCENDCITIRNISALHLRETLDYQTLGCSTIIGIKCYSVDGEYLGKITDADFDKFVLTSLILDNGTKYSKRQVLQINQELCLICPNGKSVKVSSYKPRGIPAAKQEYDKIAVQIEATPKSSIASNPHLIDSITTPKPLVTETKSLLHRITTKAIMAPNGEVIVRANTRLTRELINKSMMYGKLYELMKYSK